MLVKEKVVQAVGILKEFNIDCWITFVRESALNGDPILDFLLGSPVTWHSSFIITSSGETYAIVGKYDRATVEDCGAYAHVMDYVESGKPQLLEVMRTLNPAQIAVNYSVNSEICDGLTHGMYLTLHGYLAELGFEKRLISAEKIISALRQRKTPYELKLMKGAIRAAQDIFEDVSHFIRPGKTEGEIAAFMQGKVKEAGLELAWDVKTCPSVFSGPDTAGAHYHPTARRAAEGHILNMDFGVRVGGYCSDLQRTFYILRRDETVAPAEVQKGFNTIVTSIEMARKALRPGVKGQEIDAVARNYIVSQGYDEFPHGLGHQVGRFPHDGTALLGPPWEKYATKPFETIEEGMVFTIEPRLTVPGYGIATVEEMVIVTKTGAEFLSKPQRKLLIIKPKADKVSKQKRSARKTRRKSSR